MSDWTIKPLYFGYTSGKTPGQKDFSIPWTGFYLTDGQRKILCDTGVRDGFFVDGKSPWGYPSEGGEEYVRKALKKIGVDPGEIEIVIYTHFHWDHAGNCHLFPKASHVFQDLEWKELVDPLPSMQLLKLYDQRLISEFAKLRCRRVSGDVEFLDGLELILAPGHSAGGQCLRVKTKEGAYVIAGDLINAHFMVYPETAEWTQPDGTRTPLDPEVRNHLNFVFNATVFDHYAWFRSQYRILGMIRNPKYLIPAHDYSIFGNTYG